MAKPLETDITCADIEEFLTTQDDFSLELQVYQAARSFELHASHGGTYEDPVTAKPRQYDVRVAEEKSVLRVDLAIECKSLRRSCPLLISRIPRTSEESFHEVVCSFNRPFNIQDAPTMNNANAKAVRLKHMHSLYAKHEFVGKSTAQVARHANGREFVSTDSATYEKWSQALASAEDLIFDSTYRYQRMAGDDCVTAVLPLLVVTDDTLWVVDYGEDGKPVGKPRLCEEALLYVGREYSRPRNISFTISHLHVYTKAGVMKFLDRIKTDTDLWETIFPLNRLPKLNRANRQELGITLRR
jgi:hypothetical protein